MPLYTKIYDMCEMTIENVLSAYDVIGKNLGYLISYGNWANFAMRKKRQEFQYEATAFNLQPNATDSPWGFYFGPQNPYVILHLRMLLQMPFCIGKVATNLYRMQY